MYMLMWMWAVSLATEVMHGDSTNIINSVLDTKDCVDEREMRDEDCVCVFFCLAAVSFLARSIHLRPSHPVRRPTISQRNVFLPGFCLRHILNVPEGTFHAQSQFLQGNQRFLTFQPVTTIMTTHNTTHLTHQAQHKNHKNHTHRAITRNTRNDHTHTQPHAHTHTYAHIRTHTHTRTRTHARTHTRALTHAHTHTRTHRHTRTRWYGPSRFLRH